jgi:hypothetical protein
MDELLRKGGYSIVDSLPPILGLKDWDSSARPTPGESTAIR